MTKPMPMSPPLSHSTTATLVALCADEETAKRIESQLRNAGHPVRVAWIAEFEDFEDALKRSHPDLVLCATRQANVSCPDVVRLCARLAPDLPTVFMASEAFTTEDAIAALEAGARDLVSTGGHEQLKHLEMVCLRELREHYRRRELRNLRARLADYELRHKSLIAGTADAVLHVQEGIVTHANAALASMLGHEAPRAIEGHPLMDLVARDGQAAAKDFLKQISKGKLPPNSRIELQLQTVDDKPVKVTAQVTVGNQHGERLVALLIRAEAPAPAPQPAEATPAPAPAPTGPGLTETLDKAINANVEMHRALCVVMVDSFASIEQRLGYQESEQVLEQTGALIQQRLGAKEHKFRFSTALFAIVLSRPSPDEFGALAESLRADVAAQLFKTKTHETHLTATVVCYPVSSADTTERVIDSSVGEVRKLSRDGGNRTAVIGKTAEATKEAQEDQRKADRVKKALMENRMRLAYQSIASLEGEGRQHFDVLVRMLDDSGHEVPARDFIPAAERHGVIVAIDRWVISRALGVISKRHGTQEQSSMFVRISEHTLREGDAFFKWFGEQVKARPIKDQALVIAINESVAETHISKARALCEALKRLGAAVALDHYGAGPKPEQVLEHIPAGYVRFDYRYSKEFEDPELQAKLGTLMKHAKERGVKTIMGQVENATAMARLWQLGVNYIQGFHIQAPEAVLISADVH